MDLKGFFFGEGDTPLEGAPVEGPRDRLDSGSAAATPDCTDELLKELVAEPYGVGWRTNFIPESNFDICEYINKI